MKVRSVLRLFLMLTLLTTFASADAIGILQGLFQPSGVVVWGEEVFILEGGTVSVFSLAEMKRLRQFGREGQGPGEVEVTPWLDNLLYIFDDTVVIDSMNKIVKFSRSGELIGEMRRSEQFTQMIPVGENFAAKKRVFDEKENMQYSTINWYNPDSQTVRELYRQPLAAQRNKLDMIPDSVHFAVYGKQIFIEESPRGFCIEVFDHNGEKIHEIQKPFEKVPVESADRNEVDRLLSADPFMSNVPGGWRELKKTMQLNYPDSFPAISDIVVADGKIYVQTYKKKRLLQQYIVFDLDGNELYRTLLPELSPSGFTEQMMGTGGRLFHISHDRFYYIVAKDEGCVLYVQKIKHRLQNSRHP